MYDLIPTVLLVQDLRVRYNQSYHVPHSLSMHPPLSSYHPLFHLGQPLSQRRCCYYRTEGPETRYNTAQHHTFDSP